MDLTTAKRILELSFSFDSCIGEIDTIISEITDEEARNIWAARLGNVMRSINEQMIIPILQLYPELDRE